MKQNLDPALSFVLKYEGGYSDHPSDPGGATNLGITHSVLAEWRGASVTKQDVRELTRAEAMEIYRKRYWLPVHGDALPAGIDLAVFDCAVNQGVGRAARLLQEAAHVKPDGQIGPMTMAAIGAAPQQRLLDEFIARRMRAYASLTTLFRTFGLGWSRRLIACHGAALELLSSPQKGASS